MKTSNTTTIPDGRQYTVLEKLGSGANTVAYLAECSHGELVTKCILKEYAPHNNDDFEVGKARFLDSGKAQNKIRQFSALNNQTPPVSHVFEANGTAFIDVACYNGTTLDKLNTLTLPQYMELCLTIAKTVGYYHKSGYLCLDLKPENIFILQNAPDDTVTQLVEFIDFDSIRDVSGNSVNTVFSYTREWAAPEQLNPYATGKLGNTADIYTVGEIVFYLLLGRHSSETEHRGFSKYPFDECKREYRRYTERPDIQALFTRLFRNTIRSSASNRYKTIDEVTKLLGLIVAELNQKDYIIPILPSVSPDFVGRDTEIRQMVESLQKNNALYITGIGGIGKSTLVKNYIARYRTEYDVIAYLEYDGDIQHIKDGEEVYDTLEAIISALFDASAVSKEAKLTLKILALLNVRGLETSLINKFFPDIQTETITALSTDGWIYADTRVCLHPVIAETVRYWLWTSEKVKVMEYHKQMIDIYVGMANAVQIKEILNSASSFTSMHNHHIIRGMYFDMLGCYYDTLLGGAYYPENEEEADLLQKLIDSADNAISEMEQETDKRKWKYLTGYYLDLASILIRSVPDYYDEAANLLDTVYELIEENEPEISDNHCYYCMVSAWYYTLVQPDIEETRALTEQAEEIARQVFPTDLELIDIIHIPTANCFYYHNDFRSAADKIEEAVKICRKNGDKIVDTEDGYFNIYAQNLNGNGATDVAKIWAYGTDYDRIEYIFEP